MNKIWITSDLHFGHQREFLYEPRGFTSIYDHDEEIIKNWNSVVDVDDDVYILGDIMLNDNEYGIKLFKRLKGKIHIIRGNHDTDARMELYSKCWNVVEICEGKFLKVNKQNYFLSHYPSLTSNFDEDKPLYKKIINLCGHSHYQNKFQDMDKGIIYHCELDAHNCYPVCIDTIIEDIKNYIKE